MKIFDPKLTGSIEIQNTITGNVTIAGGLTVEGSLGGGITGSATASYVEYSNIANKPTLLSGSSQIASDISGSFTSVSSSLASRVASQESFSSSLDSTFATDAQVATAVSSLNAATSSYLLNTTDTLTGNLTVTGIIKADSSSTGDYVRLYGSSGTGQWDIYGNGENLRFSENSGGGGSVVIDSSITTGGDILIQNANPILNLQRSNNASSPAARINFLTADNTVRWQIATNQSIGTGFEINQGDGSNPRLFIDTNGNVGIGETSPIRRLHVDGGSISSDTPTVRISSTDSSGTNKFGIEFYSKTGADVRGKILADNNGRVYIDDNGGGGVVLQANGGSGSVGIGTNTPGQKLHVEGALRLTSNPSVTGDGSSAQFWNQSGVGPTIAGNAFQVQINGTTPVLHINNTGGVGLGTTSPLNAGTTIYTAGAAFSSTATKNSNMHGLTLVASTNEDTMTGVWFGTGGGSHWSGIAGARSSYASTWGTHLAFYTHPDATSNLTDTNERMRITSEGRVLINETTAGPGKFQVRSVYSSGQYFSNIQCLPSDDGIGGLVLGSISANNTLVSSGGYYSSAGLHVATDTTAETISMTGGATTIHSNTGLTVNSGFYLNPILRVDSDGIKFKGDTAAANALDDYEEGTISTTVTGITATTNSVTGIYTKIGNMVYAQIVATISGKSSGSGNPYIPLPFTPSADNIGQSKNGANFAKNTMVSGLGYLGLYGANAQVYANTTSGGYIGESAWGDGDLSFTIVYRVN